MGTPMRPKYGPAQNISKLVSRLLPKKRRKKSCFHSSDGGHLKVQHLGHKFSHKLKKNRKIPVFPHSADEATGNHDKNRLGRRLLRETFRAANYVPGKNMQK